MKYSIIAADIGGTSSRFAAFEGDSNGALILLERLWLDTTKAGSFADLVCAWKESGFSPDPCSADILVLAAAGPVFEGKYCAPPNIPWDIDLSRASNDFGFRNVVLINDFLAQAFACLSPVGKKAHCVLAGVPVGGATIAVVGAGTGLGKAALVPDERGGFVGLASEGGHTNFTPQSEEECTFYRYAKEKLGLPYLVWDEVVSGRGLSLIYEYLTGETAAPEFVAARFSDVPDVLRWAAAFYGRVCRNFALETLALGGLYVTGGIAAKNPILVEHEEFAAAFRCSHAHETLLSRLPVFLLNDEESGLWGAAHFGLQRLAG